MTDSWSHQSTPFQHRVHHAKTPCTNGTNESSAPSVPGRRVDFDEPNVEVLPAAALRVERRRPPFSRRPVGRDVIHFSTLGVAIKQY